MAWLYLPEVEDSNSDSPLLSELITEQSPTLKGSVRPLRSWLRTWNAGGWIKHLSGMTLQPSQAMPLAHSWIRSTLSQQDSLASRGQLQETEKELMTNDGSGLSYSDWFARYDPEASSWRTSQVSFMEELNTFSETWPRSGSMRNGQVFEHQTLAHPTAESGSLSWPTPTAMIDSGKPMPDRKPNPNGGQKPPLVNVAASWQTPTTIDIQRTPEGVKNRIAYRESIGRKFVVGGLGEQSGYWMTPTARDFKDGDGTANVETNGLLGRQAPRTVMPGQESQNDTGQRLNPIFVTALMGWREGWLDLTNSESSATE